MKVLMVSTDRKLFDPQSGVYGRLIEYSENVEKLVVIVFSTQAHNISQKQYTVGNLEVIQTRSFSKLVYIIDAIFLGSSIIKKMKDELSLITTQDPFETGLVGRVLSRIYSIPLHVQVHTDFLNSYYRSHSKTNYVRMWLSRKTLQQASGIRVVSKRIKDSLSKWMPYDTDTISTIPVYVEDTISETGPVPAEYVHFSDVVLCVARLEKEKRITDIITAFADITSMHPHAGLVLVGDGRLRGRLEQHVAELKIEKKVVFVGWSNNVSSYYSHARMCVFASEYEGYGMALVEAALHERPIITTDVGIVGDVLRPNESALVCDVGDTECLSKYMHALFSNKDGARAMGLRARAHVDELLIEKEVYTKRIVDDWSRVIKTE